MSQSTATAEQPVLHLQIRPSRGWSAINLREVLQFRDLLMAAGIFTVIFGKTGQFPVVAERLTVEPH